MSRRPDRTESFSSSWSSSSPLVLFGAFVMLVPLVAMSKYSCSSAEKAPKAPKTVHEQEYLLIPRGTRSANATRDDVATRDDAETRDDASQDETEPHDAVAIQKGGCWL